MHCGSKVKYFFYGRNLLFFLFLRAVVSISIPTLYIIYAPLSSFYRPSLRNNLREISPNYGNNYQVTFSLILHQIIDMQL